MLVALFGLLAICSSGCEPRPGELRDQWERSNDTFRVRIEVFDEGNRAHMFEPGCHIALSSAPAGSSRWRQFGRAYFSRCDQDLKDRVRLVNEQVAYVFMQWWYAVTVDGGASWSTWDVAAHLPGKAFYNPRLIEEVSIKPDGTGAMTLNREGTAQKMPLTLVTNNFGIEWATK
jgi:hypothetical protein